MTVISLRELVRDLPIQERTSALAESLVADQAQGPALEALMNMIGTLTIRMPRTARVEVADWLRDAAHEIESAVLQ